VDTVHQETQKLSANSAWQKSRAVYGKVQFFRSHKFPVLLGFPLAEGMAQVGIRFSDDTHSGVKVLAMQRSAHVRQMAKRAINVQQYPEHTCHPLWMTPELSP
jgi:hypothetical protein